jgi:capsule polysaccharide export protein KpsE/RkpR
MENQTENTGFTEQAADKNQYQAFNPKAALSSNAHAGAEKKWQLISLLTGILLIVAVVIVAWLAVEVSATGTQQGKLEAENQSLKEQVTLAGEQITGLKNDMEALLTRNTELTAENTTLKSQAITPAAASSKSASADRSRIEATKKGSHLNGATKEELIASMGEPDRVYNARGYEQLVYFGKKPGRFWLTGGHVTQVGG